MFHSRALNKINSVHERALRITYNDNKSIFEELLNKDYSVSICHRNLQALTIEMFKMKNNKGSELLNEIFQNRALPSNLRTNSNFSSRQVHSLYHDTESLSFLRPKIWELVPEDTKQSGSLKIFINKFKSGYPQDVLVNYAEFIFNT